MHSTAPKGHSLDEAPEDCIHCEIRRLAICAVLKEEELAAMMAITRYRSLAPGEMIFEEGEPARSLYNVASGTVRIYKLLPNGRRQITGFLFAGDFLGLASPKAYAYGAEAVTEVNLCQFDSAAFKSLVDRFETVKSRLLERANDELTVAQEQMLLLGRKTPLAKLSSFLLRLSSNNARWERPVDTIELSMTREDIADYLGLTIETVSRTFTKLKGDGVIALPERSRVVIREFDKLEEIAEDFD